LILSNVGNRFLPGSGALLTRRLAEFGSPFDVVNRIFGRYVMLPNRQAFGGHKNVKSRDT
jgi:hypothetical protein